ncbi:hypothetical protein H0H87_008136 [Tephrocybe sp. NHM501043]|nr:hypothetical protein H0H87_008136 [Tephrocybe sp. NHM501043]
MCGRYPNIAYHIDNNEEEILEMTFEDFIAHIRKNFLQDNWVRKARRDRNNFKQLPDVSFQEFLTGIMHRNLLLQNTSAFLYEASMRDLIDNNIDEDLNAHAEKERVQDEVDFKKWCEALNALDRKRMHKRKRAEKEAEDAIRKRQKQALTVNRGGNTKTSSSTIL